MKAGFVGLIGQPNAGKSTLMNFLIDQKVSIVTPRPQTTRRRVHGIWTSDQAQIVFVDAPGVVSSRPGLFEFLAQEASEVISESDVLVAVIAIDTKTQKEAEEILELVKKSRKPWLALITKSDLDDKAHRAVILQDLVKTLGGKSLSVSCTKKDGFTEEDRKIILGEIEKLLPESPAPLYDPELFTTENMRDLVREIVREKCFLLLKDEIPYSVAVRTIEFKEEAEPVPRITMEILVAKDNHKGIVIGQAGQMLKKIGQESRKEIEKLMGQKIFLGLNVTARDSWTENKRLMKELGYFHDKRN